MLVKVALLLLAGMALIGMIGRVIIPRRKPKPRAAGCPRCGRYIIGKGPCDCGKRA